MPYSRLSTLKIARAVGCHPNTVRLYEAEGLIPLAERSPKGYRLYTSEHLEQMQLAWLALNSPFPGRPLRRSLRQIVLLAAEGDLSGARRAAEVHQALVQAELAQAEAAAHQVERWRQGLEPEPLPQRLQIGEVAALLQVSVDMLRNWEANGLLQVPRNSKTGYRLYGPAEIARLRVIRMLLISGYSTMAILRMLLYYDAGHSADPRILLDTPEPDDDIQYVSDRWLTVLADHAERAGRILAHLDARQAAAPAGRAV